MVVAMILPDIYSMKKFIIIIIALIAIAGLLGGYYFYFQVYDRKDSGGENDIALGHECGEDGFACCIDQDPQCYHGLACCTNPENQTLTMCSDNCNCGEKGNFCCAGEDKCAQGLSCVDSVCVACGKEGEPCCGEGICDEQSLACSSGKCVECGKTGNPCCMVDPACDHLDLLDGVKNECSGGYCRACGTADSSFCTKSQECLPGLLKNNGQCIPCGGLDQPCCSPTSEKQECNTDFGLKCVLGFCGKQ